MSLTRDLHTATGDSRGAPQADAGPGATERKGHDGRVGKELLVEDRRCRDRLGLLGLLSWLVINRLVYRFGVIAALVVIFGILMVVAHHSDKKKQREYEEA